MEQNSKPDVVKAFIDLKKGVLQLEGSQEFVEKYLDPIMKNCKPFAASSPKGEESKEREYRYSVAESLVTLSLGMIIVALLNKSLNVSIWLWCPLAILGIISLLLALYFVVSPSHKIQEWLIRNIFNKPKLKTIKLCGWAIVLVLFGEELIKIIQTDWSAVILLLCIFAGYAVLAYAFGKSIRSIKGG